MPEQVQVTFIGIDQASDAARNVAKSLGELGSTAGGIASGGLSTLGGIAGGIVGKLAEIGVKAAETAGKLAIGFGASSLSAFKDFSQSISEIGAVTGATSDEMKKMEDKALELGAKFPVSAKDAADAMVELGKAGLNADQVISASTGTVQLASATHYNMADSATILASAINQFGLKAEGRQSRNRSPGPDRQRLGGGRKRPFRDLQVCRAGLPRRPAFLLRIYLKRPPYSVITASRPAAPGRA
jgi:phage-related minor tail protein